MLKTEVHSIHEVLSGEQPGPSRQLGTSDSPDVAKWAVTLWLSHSTGHTVTAAMRMDTWECPPGFLYAEAHLHQEGGAGSSSDLSTTSLQT